jgi:dihydroflavonol-4-reductase
MRAFVTGGTGFIGGHVVRKLVDRGYEVCALARSDSGAAKLETTGAHAVRGDIADVASMREGMQGSEVVFHIAAWYRLGTRDQAKAEAINIDGTRNVLSLAHELGVPKTVYTSTIAVLGDTKGRLVDESFYQGGPFLTEYDRTKWLAHYKVALPLIEKGAPIIIVMPGGVYGPGDHSLIGEMMHSFYRGLFPILPGPETTLTYAHVEDIAEGHILAAEKGKIGESYILAGPAMRLNEIMNLWSEITGKRAPAMHIPAHFLRPFAPLAGALGASLPMPLLFSRDAIAILGASYTARADKAQAELGWQLRSLKSGMTETFDWIAQTLARDASS